MSRIHSRDTTPELTLRSLLRHLGWHVITIWECALKKKSARAWLAMRIPNLLPKQILLNSP